MKDYKYSILQKNTEAEKMENG